MKVESERLILYPLNNEEMKAMIEKENDPEMKQAYTEMLEGCLSNPRERMWHTAWNMELKNGTGKYLRRQLVKKIEILDFSNVIR